MTARGLAPIALAFALSAPAAAQWINFKTPGVPRLPDGRPNLSAPAPRTADGKPDLSGNWQAGRAGQYGYDYCHHQHYREHRNMDGDDGVRRNWRLYQ